MPDLTPEERAEACMEEVMDVLDKYGMVIELDPSQDELVMYMMPREDLENRKALH